MASPIALTRSGAQIVAQAGILNTGVTWGTVLLGTLNLLIGGALVAFIKNMPRLREIATKRADTLDDERRGDMEGMRVRMAKLEEKVEAAQMKAQSAENKLVAAVSAIALLSAEVKRLDPEGQSPVLGQVQQLLAAATSGDFGVEAGYARIASKTGKG